MHTCKEGAGCKYYTWAEVLATVQSQARRYKLSLYFHQIIKLIFLCFAFLAMYSIYAILILILLAILAILLYVCLICLVSGASWVLKFKAG